MAKTKPKTQTRPIIPDISPEGREQQLIALATDRVEQRLRDGTASSQEIVYYLKLGSSKERLEREKLEKENELLRAKTENLQSQKHVEELIEDAIRAFKDYGGYGDDADYQT